jgi:hypothetical protein
MRKSNAMRRRGTFAVLAFALAIGGCGDEGATDDNVRFMNLRFGIGAELTDALEARSFAEFLDITAEIYGNMLASEPEVRAREMADQILAERPDFIAFDAVTKVVASGPGAVGLDHFPVFMAALAERGLNYSVVAQQLRAEFPPLPLIPPLCEPGEACTILLTGTDYILKNDDNPDLEVSNPQGADFDNQIVYRLAGLEFAFDRGWVSIDVVVHGDKKFRMINARIDRGAVPVEGSQAQLQALQAQEILDGPSQYDDGAVVLVVTHNSGGSDNTEAYNVLTANGYGDTDLTGNPDFTCCQIEELDDPVSALSSRDDYVLMLGNLESAGTYVTGTEPFQMEFPYWADSHAFLFADVRIQ